MVRVPLVCNRHSGNKNGIIHEFRTVPNRPAYTPQHKNTCNHTYTHTATPNLTTLAVCTKLQTTFFLLDFRSVQLSPTG